MGLRPGKCYRSKDKPAFSRLAIKVHRKNYIGSAPYVKTRQFNMGNPLKNYSHVVDLIVGESIQIRDNALESARISVNKSIAKLAGKDNYFLKIRIYPYQILRENKQAQGAGADRVTKGMSHAYGKPIGRAARVRKGQKIFSMLIDEEFIEAAKKSLMQAQPKIPCKLSVRVGTDVASIGTKPKRVRLIEEKKEEEAKGEEAKEEKAEEKTEKKEGKADKKAELKKELQKEKLKEKISGKE